MKENIMGIDVCRYNYNDLSTILIENIDKKQKSFIVAINPEKIMKAQEDQELKKLLNSADYQIPDGVGIIIASKLKRGNIRDRVTGIDMMLRLCEEAANNNKRIFLYGGSPGVAQTAKQELERRYPNIKIVGTIDGYEKDEQLIENAINESKADILFVALGSPKQEYWITKKMNQLHPTVYQGVGGSFDVISGDINRAPEVFQKYGLEWFYRLLKEPWRIKRQMILPKFLISALKK
ncbi:WecB/TagA/CpsF family glycosyltransferase [Cytobacillus gottheilii]|uniref:WecB/TagA/CpsF family glycosyltransferase n=1 Tax=Cytobacillus gottheilii TaxID=859144 RepID=UPI0009BBCBC2|nr:WecB/TagA/CpsF family glycosyltransferase [Cytobacillus gottheilii]